jgi:Fe-S cluster biogenesis protein NfuA
VSKGALPTPQQRRSVFIKCSTTPNEFCRKFHSKNVRFFEEKHRTMSFDHDTAHQSPLAKRLLELPTVINIMIGDTFVTVMRGEDVVQPQVLVETESVEDGTATANPAGPDPAALAAAEEASREAYPSWFDLENDVCALIMDHLASGEAHVTPDAPHPHADTFPQEGDSEVVVSIKELIADVIRPVVQGDGGDVRFVGFDPEAGALTVELLGACKTCRSASTTLKDIISRTAYHWIPEVKAVVELNRPELRGSRSTTHDE